MKKIIKFLKLFRPPILSSRTYRDLKRNIFDSTKIIHQINYENNFYKRHAFINKAISNYRNCKYLEIGVADNDVFDSVPLSANNKYGVDPVQGGNFRMTSDHFFEKYPDLMFDVIFIDGLHEYEQCQRDCINSMNRLNKDGVIFIHDLLPRSYFEEHVPRKQSSWTGDIWKVSIELMNSKNLEFKIINIDMGIGVIKIHSNFEYKKMPELKNKNFSDFLNYYKTLPLINSEQALNYI